MTLLTVIGRASDRHAGQVFCSDAWGFRMSRGARQRMPWRLEQRVTDELAPDKIPSAPVEKARIPRPTTLKGSRDRDQQILPSRPLPGRAIVGGFLRFVSHVHIQTLALARASGAKAGERIVGRRGKFWLVGASQGESTDRRCEGWDAVLISHTRLVL